MTPPVIAVVDHGLGNRRSVEKALERVGATAVVTYDPGALRAADGLVIPGVGSFPAAMREMDSRGLSDVVRERAAAGTPVLGICLGMQLLFSSSTEHGGAAGLGLIEGAVERLEPAPGDKLPHIGWNLVTLHRPSAITDGLPERCPLYHVHTYAVHAADERVLIGTGEYGRRFASIVGDPERPLFGAQCHPEKSSRHGLRLLENFARVCVPVPA